MKQVMHRAVPTYIFNTGASANGSGTANGSGSGNDFRARPLKQWRRQLSSSRITSSVSIGMPMDRPGGSVPLSNACADSGECFGFFGIYFYFRIKSYFFGLDARSDARKKRFENCTSNCTLNGKLFK